jgi:hypothetical protein
VSTAVAPAAALAPYGNPEDEDDAAADGHAHGNSYLGLPRKPMMMMLLVTLGRRQSQTIIERPAAGEHGAKKEDHQG